MTDKDLTIPGWFAKVVAAVASLLIPWAIFMTYTIITAKVQQDMLMQSMKDLKQVVEQQDKDSHAFISQVVEIKAELKYLSSEVRDLKSAIKE